MSSRIIKKKGFGLLEVLLASLVIIMVTMALSFLGRAAISNVSNLQQRSQATFLAQEAIEVVRQIRDTNYIDNVSETQWASMDYARPTVLPSTSPVSYHRQSTGTRLRLSDQTPYGDVSLGGVKYRVWITFSHIGDSNIITSPSLLPNSSDNTAIINSKAYNVKVEVRWGDEKKVYLSELITDSRQGF